MAETNPVPEIAWRGPFVNDEVLDLHAAAFGGRRYSADEWDWEGLVQRHSLGWVTARHAGTLVGFANVVWDGLVHAWIQDVIVDPARQRSGIGVLVVDRATEAAREAGCEWLHVDFDDDVADFYYRRLGFQKTNGGLRYLQ